MIFHDRSFVLLDASLTVKDALGRMDGFPNARWVVVRRVDGVHVYWYSYEAPRARAEFARSPAEATVRVALDQHEWQSKPTHVGEAPGAPPPAPGDIVLTPTQQVIAVATSEPAPAPAPTRPPRRARVSEAPAVPPPAARRRGLAPATPPPAPRRGGGARAEPPTAAAPPAAAEAPKGEPMFVGPPGVAPAMAPFSAWPDLDAPPLVTEGRSFALKIGFSIKAVAGVAGGPVVIAEAPPDFDLDVQVLAAGFDAPKGLRHQLRVHRDDPTKHAIFVALAARSMLWPDGQDVDQRVLSVTFAYQGNTCGVAMRNILVARAGTRPTQADMEGPTSFIARQPVAPQIRFVPGAPTPDLTVTLMRSDGNVAQGNFVWGFESPHAVALPPPVDTHLGTDAASFARAITSQTVTLGDAASPLVKQHLIGSGRKISDHVPKELWDSIQNVLAHVRPAGGVPDVFFVTEESCVPWELAWMPSPHDAKAPDFLGAQVNFGRWIVGSPEPAMPPDAEVDVMHIVVMFGDYDRTQGTLPEAIEEKDKLASAYHAEPISMIDAQLVRVLEGNEPRGGCELLHFACHGVGDPTQPGYTHLVMQGGAPFTENAFRGGELGHKRHPFVFMNACEAGTAGDELDTTSGFVEATLKSGCTGFVGGLWEVASTTARDIAIEFYKLTLDDGLSVAAAMREIRCKFDLEAKVPDDTYLAYVFYGHPGLKLTRKP